MKYRISRIMSSSGSQPERGATMFLAAIMMLIVLMSGAIAVDLSITANRGQDLQNAADAAALAGVQALRESMGSDTTADAADRQAAEDAVAAILRQNGIDDLTPNVEFPTGVADTEVKVSITDGDPGLLLSGVTGVDGSVTRTATAKFERCESGCTKEVAIPPPFRAVNATGQGDGYKPIPVGTKLYALNHNSTALQIVCVDREEDYVANSSDPAEDGLCWDTPSKNAYPTNWQPARNPEMPNTAVVGSRIFWSVTLNAGHYLFCFETLTATPCSSPFLISNLPRNWNNPTRTENRGGGTMTPDQQHVYVFTDDNRIHCIHPYDWTDPTTGQQVFIMETCGGYEGGKLTGLGSLTSDDDNVSLWPAGDPNRGNHGSSIDRIYDAVENRAYHTLHLDWVPATGPPDYCSTLDTYTRPPRGSTVTFKNAQSGLYIAVDTNGDIIDGIDAQDEGSQWVTLRNNSGTIFAFRNVANDQYLTLSSNYPVWNEPLTLLNSFDYYDSIWRIEDAGSSVRIHSYETHNDGTGAWDEAYIKEEAIADPNDPTATDFGFVAGEYVPVAADWLIRPAECEIEDDGPDMYEGVAYEQGTYVDCWDFNMHLPCMDTSGFKPSKIHNDWDSFSGRLFFHMTSENLGKQAQAVCSTGFTEHWEWKDMSAATELACVDIVDGSERTDLEGSMGQFMSALAETNKGNIGEQWGTWGDPHYNAHTNRLFFPTQRAISRVLCWDFDSGWCGERQAFSGLGEIQDYGFFSEGNCVFGLGHRAIFWAFKAADIHQDCSGSSATAWITPCDCGGNLKWGTLTFDVDLPSFDSFLVELHDAPDKRGNRVYPPDNWVVDPNATAHSLHQHGATIDLDFLPALARDQQLWVTVTVEADGDPWANGDQKFAITFEQFPKLTD